MRHLSWPSLLAVVFVVGSVGCDRTSRENAVDPVALLPRLTAATSAEQRLAILDALSTVQPETRPAGAPDPLTAVRPLLADADPRVAAKAGELLASWGDRAATGALARLLKNPDPRIRLSAVTSLRMLADPASTAAVVGAGNDSDGTVRAEACAALARLSRDEAVTHVLRAHLSDSDDAVRAAAAEALGARGSGADVSPLVALLKDADPGVVSAAARALGVLHDGRAVPALLALLGGSNQATRAAAANALGRLGDRVAVSPLVDLLRSDDPVLRLAALSALGDLKDPAALGAVLNLAGDPEPRVAERVPYIVVRLYTAGQFEVLTDQLHAADPQVRAAAALGLGMAGDRRASAGLAAALTDPAAPVRANAAVALGILGVDSAREDIRRLAEQEPDPEARETAQFGRALAESDASGVVPRLVSVLDDQNPRMRMFAADALGLLAAADAVESLRHATQRDPDAKVRAAASLALQRMSDADL